MWSVIGRTQSAFTEIRKNTVSDAAIVEIGWSVDSTQLYRLRQINIEIAFSKNIEMTGFYHTILKFPDTRS